MKVFLGSAPWSFANVAPRHLIDSSGWIGRLAGIGRRQVKGPSPAFGLLYLASMLRSKGHEIVLAEGGDHTLPMMLELIERERPDLIGIGLTTPLWPATQRFAREIKDRFDVPIVIGGPFPTTWRQRCLDECDAVDYVVVGEGELITLDLIEALEHRMGFAQVDGLAWRHEGRSVMNKPAKVPQDLDALPFPARDLVDLPRYVPSLVRFKRLPTTQFFSTRGCPFQCNFCWVNPVFRKRSIPNIMEELREIHDRYGVHDFTLFDDDTTLDKNHTLAIAEGILSAGLDFSWNINARVDGGYTVDHYKTLRRAGVWRVLFGIESGVQKNLDGMWKRTKLESIREGVRTCRKGGVAPYGTFIFGAPGETYEDGLATIDFATSLGLEYASFSVLTPFPGTAFFNQIGQERMFDWSRFTGDGPCYQTDAMTQHQLESLLKLAYRRFYFRPSYILKRGLRSLTSMEEMRKNIAAWEGLRKIDTRTIEEAQVQSLYAAPERMGAVGCGTVAPDAVPARAREAAS